MASVPPPPTASDEEQRPRPSGDSDVALPDEPPWPLWTAPAAVVLGLALGVFGSVLVSVIAHVSGSSLTHPTPAVSIISDVVFDLAFVLAALYFASLQGRPQPWDFGFRRVGAGRAAIAAVAAAIAYYIVTAIYASVFKLHGSDKLPSELGVNKSTAALVTAAIFVCVLAPVAEEFFFRGFIFGALRRWRITAGGRQLGPWVAAVLTGILFGLAHTGSASPQYLVPLGFLGFVLCLVRWRTRSLYPCIALHSVNNSLALGINQLGWNAGEIVALAAGALAVIGVATLPLSGPRRHAVVAPRPQP